MLKRSILLVLTIVLLNSLVACVPTSEPPPTPTTSIPEAPSTSKEASNAPEAQKSHAWELPPSSYLPDVPRIIVEEVKVKMDADSNIVIVDSRSKSSYDQDHIVGAISIPLSTMTEPYGDLEGYDEIITYCT